MTVIHHPFIEMVCQRPVPKKSAKKIRTLAKELAEGTDAGLWRAYMPPVGREFMESEVAGAMVVYMRNVDLILGELEQAQVENAKFLKVCLLPLNELRNLTSYLQHRWNGERPPLLRDLLTEGYIQVNKDGFFITEQAFAYRN